jgi:hypothetical protein
VLAAAMCKQECRESNVQLANAVFSCEPRAKESPLVYAGKRGVTAGGVVPRGDREGAPGRRGVVRARSP